MKGLEGRGKLNHVVFNKEKVKTWQDYKAACTPQPKLVQLTSSCGMPTRAGGMPKPVLTGSFTTMTVRFGFARRNRNQPEKGIELTPSWEREISWD